MEEARRRLAVLDRIAEILYGMVDAYFGGDPRLRDYVAARVSRARELLSTRLHRLRSARLIGPRTLRVVFASSLSESSRPEKKIALRTIDGSGVVEVSVGEPVEKMIHFTEVSPAMLKCSCEDAIYTAAAADNVARSAGLRTPVFHRYTLCKHSLAALAYAASHGIISLEDPVLRKTLRLALLAAYLRLYRGRLKALEAVKRFEAELEPMTSTVN